MRYLVMTAALLVALSAGLSPDIVTAQTRSAGGQNAATAADRVDLNRPIRRRSRPCQEWDRAPPNSSSLTARNMADSRRSRSS